MPEASYDPIYTEILENVKEVIISANKVSNNLRSLLDKYIKSAKVSPILQEMSCYAIDGSMMFQIGTGFVTYAVTAEAVPINAKRRISLENVFLMLPTIEVKERVATRMHTLESIAALRALEENPFLIMIDGLISTQIFKLLRWIYTRYRLGKGDPELFKDIIGRLKTHIEDHWRSILDEFEGSQKIRQTNKIKSLFYSESGERGALNDLINYFTPEIMIYESEKYHAIENAILTLEILEGIIAREMLIEEAKVKNVNIIGVAKRSSGYSLRNSSTVLQKLGIPQKLIRDIQNVSDIVLATLLLRQDAREYVVSPLFYVYYREHVTKRIRDAVNLIKDVAPHVASIAELATKIYEETIESLEDYERFSKEMEKQNFYVGYARFAPYQRPYKFEVIINAGTLEETMNFVYSTSKNGYPQPLILADTVARKPRDFMLVFSGTLADFIKKYFSKKDEKERIADFIIRQLMSPYREHLVYWQSTFTK